VIALTHVCRAWRDLFISWSSLWTDIDCEDVEKAEVYLERSKPSPINLSLRRGGKAMSPRDPFFRMIPDAIGRLKSLWVRGTEENLQDIAASLSPSVPLLEELVVSGVPVLLGRNPILPPALFNGDLSRPHSSTEISLRCASCLWRLFAPSYLGGT